MQRGQRMGQQRPAVVVPGSMCGLMRQDGAAFIGVKAGFEVQRQRQAWRPGAHQRRAVARRQPARTRVTRPDDLCKGTPLLHAPTPSHCSRAQQPQGNPPGNPHGRQPARRWQCCDAFGRNAIPGRQPVGCIGQDHDPRSRQGWQPGAGTQHGHQNPGSTGRLSAKAAPQDGPEHGHQDHAQAEQAGLNSPLRHQRCSCVVIHGRSA